MPLACDCSQALGPIQYEMVDIVPIDYNPRHVRERQFFYLRRNGDEPEAAAHALLRALLCLSNVGATTIFTWHDPHNITAHTDMESTPEIITEMWEWRHDRERTLNNEGSIINALSSTLRIAQVAGDEAWWCCFTRGERVGSYVTTNWMGEPEGLSIFIELDPTCLPLGLSWELLLWVLEVGQRHRHVGALEARRGAPLTP